METTPLELYETAYRFHYNENRLADAVAYYQKLIKEFPGSNECGYAVIQLQKIKVHEVAATLQKPDSPHVPAVSSSHPAAVIALIVSLVALGALGYSYRTLNKKIVLERKRTSLAIGILGRIARRENDEALKQLSELKKIYTDDISLWEISADIYRRQHRFDDARKEYTAFFEQNHDRKPTEREKRLMELQGKPVVQPVAPTPAVQPAERKPAERKPAVQEAAPQSAPPASIPTAKKRLLRSPTKAVKPPPPGPAKRKSGLFLVDPDSITYF